MLQLSFALWLAGSTKLACLMMTGGSLVHWYGQSVAFCCARINKLQFLCACDVITTVVSVESGLGRHVWTITDPHTLAAGLVSSEIVYASAVVPIKISMLYLYQRVFPSRKLFYISLSLGIFIVLYSTAQVLTMALQCLPLSALWTGEPAQCINIGLMVTVMG